MSVNLQKGQKIDLTKDNAGLKKLRVGLGWDPVKKKGGFFSIKPANIDCDASVFACDANGRLKSKEDIVYFGNLHHHSKAINHAGDNLTGDGDGDDEQILVDLAALPPGYEKLVFVVNIYKAWERKQHFGMLKNAYIRIMNDDTKQELCRYNLAENYDGMTAMIFGEVYQHGSEWKFSAIGQPTQDKGLTELAARYR